MTIENIQYSKATSECLKYLENKCREFDLVKQEMMKRFPEKASIFLLGSDDDKVSESAYDLTMQLLSNNSNVSLANEILMHLLRALPEALETARIEGQTPKGIIIDIIIFRKKKKKIFFRTASLWWKTCLLF